MTPSSTPAAPGEAAAPPARPSAPPARPSTPPRSLRSRSIEGMVWTVLSSGGSQILRFGANLVLTRLLVPEHFAVMALMNTVLIGLELFSDVGIQPSIIQNPRGEERAFLDTAWSFQVLRGLALWLMTLALAYPVALFYEVPLLLALLPVGGLSALMRGFAGTSLATLNRRLAIRPLVLLELAAQVVGIATMIGWAWVAPSPWALVAGSLTSSGVMLVWSHRLEGSIRHRFRFEPEARRELLGFGRWVFVSTALTFLGGQSDRLILGKLFPLALFGVFGLAQNIAALPDTVLGRVAGLVLFPAMAEMKDRPPQELAAVIRRARRRPVLGLMLLLPLGVVVSDYAIRFLYEENYWDAAWMLPILMAGISVNVLTKTTAPALIALGHPQKTALASFARFLFLAIGLPISFTTAGPLGAVVLLAFAEVSSYLVCTLALRRLGLSFIRQDALFFALFAVTLAAVLSLRVALGFGLPA